MIRRVEDFNNKALYDEMIINGEEKQSKEELSAIIDEYNENASRFNQKNKTILIRTYNNNWKSAEKRYNKQQQKIRKQNEKEQNQIRSNIENERKLEEKFGIQFHNRTWFRCTIEERKYSTFSNTDRRDVDTAYVFVEDTYLEIAKESVFLKTNMGHRKLYYQNIAGIDYDARGKFHASNGLVINLKSSEHVQLKNIPEKWVTHITTKYEQFLSQENEVAVQPTENKSSVDDLMKYAELYEKGLVTKEEFDLKKAEIMGTPTAAIPESEPAAKFCSKCGASISSDSNFCTNCGNPVN